MFWKDLLPLWQKTCKLPSVWLETLEKHCQKQCFGRISYLKSPHGGKPPLAPLTDRNKPAVWAATPREAGWINTYDFGWWFGVYKYVSSCALRNDVTEPVDAGLLGVF